MSYNQGRLKGRANQAAAQGADSQGAPNSDRLCYILSFFGLGKKGLGL